ncbi:MAG: polysulfide reductase NrfD [Candidatus Omnitrophica bacterium]|nr:polysulfide reductase NrfD [Candidatus Omnitrophota bacterium]
MVSLEEKLLNPIKTFGKGGRLLMVVLLFFIALGFSAWIRQLISGLCVTGMNKPVLWGVYITNFVFFVGISHAGTFISAILRILHAEWRRPLTRAAEAVTVFSLPFAAVSIVADLGRPGRILNVIRYARIQSPILWDVTCIGIYLLSSVIFFYLALLPDIAICRDKLTDVSKFKRWLYRKLSFGWQAMPEKQKKLEKGMAVFLTVLVVTVHTVVAWIFGMTVQPGWRTTIIGPYFLVGAIFSGVATVIIISAILRKLYHLEDILKPIHFNNLGKLLLVLSLFWFYFTFTEYLSAFYWNDPMEMSVVKEKFFGDYARLFWFMVISCFVIPLFILVNPKTRTITGTVIVSMFVNVGMWLERFLVIIPTLSQPRLPYSRGIYHPTWVEWSITLACFSGLILLYLIFAKLFPVISIWEMKEGKEKAIQEVTERYKSYHPEV